MTGFCCGILFLLLPSSCTFTRRRKKITWFSLPALIPAVFMLSGVIRLVSERIQKLDWVLPEVRLVRRFGTLTLDGVPGIHAAAAGRIASQGFLCRWMLAGACLCALFAWLMIREDHPQGQGGERA